MEVRLGHEIPSGHYAVWTAVLRLAAFWLTSLFPPLTQQKKYYVQRKYGTLHFVAVLGIRKAKPYTTTVGTHKLWLTCFQPRSWLLGHLSIFSEDLQSSHTFDLVTRSGLAHWEKTHVNIEPNLLSISSPIVTCLIKNRLRFRKLMIYVSYSGLWQYSFHTFSLI